MGYFRRMAVYLREMFPPHVHLVSSSLIFLATSGFLATAHGRPASFALPFTAVGIAGLFLLLLLLRLMDELKDRDVDRALFAHRPLPSGRVHQSDIITSIAGTVLVYVLVNSIVPRALWAAALLLGFAFLMFRYFFIPDISRNNLLMNLATHQPIVPLMLLYAIALFAAEHDMTMHAIAWSVTVPFVLMGWTALACWEIARKIRAPQEENEYVTYSRILGPKGAVAFCAGLQSLAFSLASYLFVVLGLSWKFLAISATAYALALFAHLRFLRTPTPKTSAQLKRAAERFAALFMLANILEHYLLR